MKFRPKILFVMLLSAYAALFCSGQEKEKYLGSWGMDDNDMPCFSYTGSLPYSVNMKNGASALIDDDPYFLLGNYRFKLFAHISGEYQIMSTERVISSLNKKENTKATLSINGTDHRLTGTGSLAADPGITSRVFGAGFAEYTYSLPSLTCKRIITILPSEKINKGVSAFRISVFFKNTSDKRLKISYTESISTLYDKVTNSADHDDLDYEMVLEKRNENLVTGSSKVISHDDPFPIVSKRNDVSYNEYFPPRFFISAPFDSKNKWKLEADTCSGNYSGTLKSGEERRIDFIIGYSIADSEEDIEQSIAALMEKPVMANYASAISEIEVSKEWSKRVDHFTEEGNDDLRRELIWHNYVLEVLATHSEYFNETFIPQGCMYLFTWGLNAAPRDENQHALAACYTHPELARSVMRYILKKSDIKGNIPFNQLGNGVVTSKFYQTSDQQLFFFLLLSEYLRITGDYSFLLEEVPYYPVHGAPAQTVLNRIGDYYRYLLEDVGLGPHGLIRLGNSDWNDIVFYRMDTKYNSYYYSNESFMNTTMAASVFPNLVRELRSASKLQEFDAHEEYLEILSNNMDNYRNKLWDNFIQEHGSRTFAKRMYFNQEAVGVDNMFLEPQGFLMQVEEYGPERKKKLYSEIQDRILNEEKTGARQEEKMELSELNFGSRENGGIWYSLNGPLIIGLSTWNMDAAWKLFHRLT